MATPFSEIYERAVLKFSDYDFLKLSESEREYILEKYLMSAQADFEKMCRIDLSQIDTDYKEYKVDLDNEVIEILALGIAYYWVSSKVLDSTNLSNSLSVKDYSFFSPANLLREMTEFRNSLYKEYRRKLKRIYAALEENCSAAAYGESQVGKSYLMSSLLSSPNSPFVITNAGKSYSFIDDINPSGGNNAKIESTGVITRFTLSQGCSTMSDFVKVRNLSVVDIILLLADSYYNDIKINQDSVLRYDDINNGLWASKIVAQNEIDEDDVKDITDYIHDVIGNAAAGVNQSNFCKIVAPVIQYVSYDNIGIGQVS